MVAAAAAAAAAVAVSSICIDAVRMRLLRILTASIQIDDTTKQACRDEIVAYLSFSSIYICIYI